MHPRQAMPDKAMSAAEAWNNNWANKQRQMRLHGAGHPAVPMMDHHHHGPAGSGGLVAPACSPALQNAGQSMGLDADLENAMQWLNAEMGHAEDGHADKVGLQ